jgi:hypothetical protein
MQHGLVQFLQFAPRRGREIFENDGLVPADRQDGAADARSTPALVLDQAHVAVVGAIELPFGSETARGIGCAQCDVAGTEPDVSRFGILRRRAHTNRRQQRKSRAFPHGFFLLNSPHVIGGILPAARRYGQERRDERYASRD